MEKTLYVLVRRVKRLIEEIEIDAPQIIIKNEIALVKNAINDIESLYSKKDEKDVDLN